MASLFPHLGLLEAQRGLSEFRQCVQSGGSFEIRFSSPHQKYSPLGGSPVDEATLKRVREGVLQLASDQGFPAKAGTAAKLKFDRATARYLNSTMGITENEAAKPGVWRFLCCVVLPDVVAWRFPPKSEDATDARFLDGNRNTLGRLWWRAEVFKDLDATDQFHLIDELQEDELVQVTERPAIARSRTMARAMASVFIRYASSPEAQRDSLPRMHLMRDLAKRILRTGAVIAFDVLDEEQAAAFVRIELAHAREAMRARREVAVRDISAQPSVKVTIPSFVPTGASPL